MGYDFIYKINDQDYVTHVTYKRIKSITIRFKNNEFFISCSIFNKHRVNEILEKYALKLIKKSETLPPIGNDYIYLLGEKYPLNSSGNILLINKNISYKNQADLNKKLRSWFLSFIIDRVDYYQKIMNIPGYHVRVRNMTSRYGSNSLGSNTVCFTLSLMHYSIDIIDAVVVHELAHYFVRNHSKNFYNVCYKYCPNYQILHKKLRKNEYK